MANDTFDEHIDELDRFILRTMQEDGRIPFSTIAKQANVSESTIRNRYLRMVDSGLVRTVASVDPYALGFQAPALIGVNVKPGTADAVAKELVLISEVSYLVMTLGSFDLMVELFCRDLPHLTNLLIQRIQTIPNVQSTQTLMIARSYKLTYRWAPALTAMRHSTDGN
jgi:Lrp/AsnC family transcriptional regulator for asnA, asnC and gidA